MPADWCTWWNVYFAVMLTKLQASRPRPKNTIGKTKTKTEEGKSNTKTKTNVIAADKVIIIGKVAIIVSIYSTLFCMFSLFLL